MEMLIHKVPRTRVPIALTGRADKPLSQLASCALALLLARQHWPVAV